MSHIARAGPCGYFASWSDTPPFPAGAPWSSRWWFFFALTLGTTYHQLAIGLLTSAIVLPCCLIIFEIIWQAVAAIADFLGEEAKNRPGKF
jgi:hypothetical protein